MHDWRNTCKLVPLVTLRKVVSPPQHMPYLARVSSVAMVDKSLQAREAARKLLQFYLKRA
ncbi:reverse transcriptase [Gossypium australe]|uniref:Reverse transcriptase n=1 Tax=Gossypium australe TaxID=47621 RepID=A0A5B6X751_9ROSI|nr:reverse transcriptase [Gossypium australe]